MDVQCATTKAQRLIRISTVGKLDYNVFLKADVLPNQSRTSVHSAWVFATSAHVVKDTGRPVAMLLPSYGRPGSQNTKQMPCPDSGSLWDLTPLRNKNYSHSFGLGPTPSGAGGISGRPYGRSQILEVVPLVNCQPPAKDNMVILFLVDCFSKTSKFMPLPKLSSAK
ncbi:hypothetical protein AOLI_G00196260 [Acnodon oligacanthus]